MSNIKRLKDNDGNYIYPVTHASAVFNNNKSIDEILNDFSLKTDNMINVKNPPAGLNPLMGTKAQDDVGPLLQAMIDSLPLVTSSPLTRNGVIYIPNGKYYIKTPITIPLGVSLVGEVLSIGYANPNRGFGSLLICDSDTVGAMFNFQGSTLKGFGGCMRNLTFTGSIPNGSCVALTDVFCFCVDNCCFEYMDAKCAIRTNGMCNRCDVIDSTFVFVGDGGINGTFSKGNAIYYGSAADSTIVNCFIESCGGNAITLGTDCKVVHSFMDLNKNGISISGKHNKVANCTIKLNYYNGVYLNKGSDYTTISDSSILFNNRRQSGNTGSASSNIYVGGSKWFMISNCQLEGKAGQLDINIEAMADVKQKGFIENCHGRDGEIIILDNNNVLGSTVEYDRINKDTYNIKVMTDAEYNELEVKDPNVIYFIVEE